MFEIFTRDLDSIVVIPSPASTIRISGDKDDDDDEDGLSSSYSLNFSLFGNMIAYPDAPRIADGEAHPVPNTTN